MIKAIETKYKGYRFRSRLEARWAVFFDAIGIEWEYEPEGYDLGAEGWYLPDFKIFCGDGQNPAWFEVKGKKATKTDIKKLEALCEGTDMHGFIASGTMETPSVKVNRKRVAEVTGAKIFHRWPKSSIKNGHILENDLQLSDYMNDVEKNAICAFYADEKNEFHIDHLYAKDTSNLTDLIANNIALFLPNSEGDHVDITSVFKGTASKIYVVEKILETGNVVNSINIGGGRFYRSKMLKSAYQKARSARFEHGETPA